jgi:hypothetical protein
MLLIAAPVVLGLYTLARRLTNVDVFDAPLG